MILTHRKLVASILGALIGVGCTADDAAQGSNEPADQSSFTALEACALPRTCSWPVSSGSPEEGDSARCVISELEAGRSLSVETRLLADGDPNCEVHRELHFFAETSTAYHVWWRKNCKSTPDARVVKQCKMLERDAYTTCLKDFDASRSANKPFACSVVDEWMSDCKDVETPTCPVSDQSSEVPK